MMEGAMSVHGDAKLLVGRQIDAGGTASHAKWSYGSAQLKGIDSSVEYTAQLKVATLPSSEDGLFALMDGGRSPEVPQALRAMLAGVLGEELARDKAEAEAGVQSADPLQYLTHTFLVAHKKLGEIAQSHGCSVVLCHLHALRTGAFVLNVANTGLGEAILCRRGRAVPLTTPHSPTTNIQERARVVEASGFISQDNRVNGVCGASRLIGCYHLWPQVVPAPSTESVELMVGDEFVVLGTDSLWKFVTHEQAVLEVQNFSSPAQAARRLRDLAVAHGCSTDVSVIVIKLNVFGTAPERKVKVRALRTIPEPVVSEDDDYGVEFTNIDDLLSDVDEEPSATPGTTRPVKITKLADKPDVKLVSKRPGPLQQDFTADDLDRLVLSAVITPPSSPQAPTVKTTNIDDLIFDNSPSDLDSVIANLEATHASVNGRTKPAPRKSHRPRPSPSSSRQQPEESYPSKTLPKEAAHHQHAESDPLNYPTQTIPRETSGWSNPNFEKAFEQTQSVPALASPRRPHSESDALGDHLALLNEAMSQLDREVNPRRHANINRRLSYVEHSYKQLTNDTYNMSGSSFVQSTTNALDLDQWSS